MEFEDHEEGKIGLQLCTHDELPRNPNIGMSAPVKMAAQIESDPPPSLTKPRYRECLKNHAVGLGCHALDGCGEFIAGGEEGTLESLKCAACNCHRNFHRKENDGRGKLNIHNPQPLLISHYGYRGPSGYLHLTPHQERAPALLALPLGGDEMEEYYSNPSSSGGVKKRFRTKFSQEQKDKMVNLSERLGWRIQKQDEELVQQFCDEVGIKRNVLKVWMHNNKHTLGKKF